MGSRRSKTKALCFVAQGLFLLLRKRYMPGLGFITTGNLAKTPDFTIPTDESVCGLLFDYSEFDNPFNNYPDIESNFGSEQVALINNLEELADLGITEDSGFMSGLVYYHVKKFYDFTRTINSNGELEYNDIPLYLCLSAVQYGKWTAIEAMQMASGGKIFQIGIWTSKQLWSYNQKLSFTSLPTDIEEAVEELTGKAGEETMGVMPLSVVLSANTYRPIISNYTIISNAPDGTALNCPKVSVVLMQDGTDNVHTMQSNLPNNTPVGCIGITMATIHNASAEQNIGYVNKFDLNVNDDFNNAEICFCGSYIALDDINYIAGNLMAERGYILPCQYKAKVASVFFSGDPTLSDGDYNSIANNRVMHKVRRATYMALLPYLHASHLIDTSTGEMSATAQAVITQAIIDTVKSICGSTQISDFTASVSKSSSILQGDSITIETWTTPTSSSSEINEKSRYDI